MRAMAQAAAEPLASVKEESFDFDYSRTPLSSLLLNSTKENNMPHLNTPKNIYSKKPSPDSALDMDTSPASEPDMPSPNTPKKHRMLGGLKDLFSRPRSRSDGATVRKQLEARRAARMESRPSTCQFYVTEPIEEGSQSSASLQQDLDSDMERERSGSSGANFLVLRQRSTPRFVEVMGRLDNQEESYKQFLLLYTCYDLIPFQSTVVLLDSYIKVRHAFLALMENGASAAPIRDEQQKNYVGILTQTDFVFMLAQSCHSGQQDADLHSLSWWFHRGPKTLECLDPQPNPIHSKRTRSSYYKRPDLVMKNCNTTLLDAVETLCDNGIQRLAIYEPERDEVLGVLSMKAVLKLLQRQIRNIPSPNCMRTPLHSLDVGTWSTIETVTPETTVLDACDLFLKWNISSLPVLVSQPGSAARRVKDVLCKSDILKLLSDMAAKAGKHLAIGSENNKSPSIPYKEIAAQCVKSALEARRHVSEGAATPHMALCQTTDNLLTVIDKLSTRRAQCVYVVDEDGTLKGAISVSDVMRFLVNHGKPQSTAL